jgi:tetratricopeptide (TPR) repeat protein
VRLLPLLLVGLVLIAVAWGVRSSRWMRETILRGKDLPELEAMERSQPDDSLTQYYLAKQYYVQHRFAEAVGAYEAAVRLDPNWARARLGLALSYYEQGQRDRDQAEFEHELRLYDKLAWAEYMLGKIAWYRNSMQEALPHLQRAVALDPRSDQAWYGLAACYIQLNRRNEALDAMRQAVARSEANAQYHTTLGELLVYLGKTEEGRQHYARALQLQPDYGPANALMGSLYLYKTPGMDSLDKAEQYLLRAAKLPSYHPQDIYLDLGQLYSQQAKFKKAVPALQEAIRLDPRDERPYYLLAQAYRRLGDTKRAAATDKRFQYISKRHVEQVGLEARLTHDPGDTVTRLRLARVYRDLGLTPQAIQQYLVYRRQRPGDVQAARELGQLVQQAKQTPNRLNQDFALPSLR